MRSSSYDSRHEAFAQILNCEERLIQDSFDAAGIDWIEDGNSQQHLKNAVDAYAKASKALEQLLSALNKLELIGVDAETFPFALTGTEGLCITPADLISVKNEMSIRTLEDAALLLQGVDLTSYRKQVEYHSKLFSAVYQARKENLDRLKGKGNPNRRAHAVAQWIASVFVTLERPITYFNVPAGDAPTTEFSKAVASAFKIYCVYASSTQDNLLATKKIADWQKPARKAFEEFKRNPED